MQEINKKLSEQSVEKVLDRPEYRKELSIYWEGLKEQREKVAFQILRNGGIPKRITIDRVGKMDADQLVSEFKLILDRKSELPASLRYFISDVCGKVFISWFTKVIEDEAKENNDTREGN
jgi:hypothetical protein